MKKILIYTIAAVFLATTIGGVFVESVSAAPTAAKCDDDDFRKSLEKFYLNNSINTYDPCSEDTCASGGTEVVVPSSSSSSIKKTPTIETIYKYLTTTNLSTNDNKPLSPVQASGIMGNFDAESGFNPSAIEDTSRAQKGHGLAQWTFGRWNNLSNFAAQQGKPWDDVTVQLDFLKSELEGPERRVLSDPDFKTSPDPAVTALRWRVVFERADPKVAHDDRRITSSVAIFNLFGGQAANCSSSIDIVAGNFLKTARNLALETPATEGVMIKQSDARKSYQDVKPKYNTTGDWTDCGVFVSVSLISSGVDKNFPPSGTEIQAAYVRKTTDKYKTIEKPTITDLQAGDIMFIKGHVTIYTGDAKYPMLDASLGGRVPSVRPADTLQWMLSQPDLMVAKVIK